MNDLSAVQDLLEDADTDIRACRISAAQAKAEQAEEIGYRLWRNRLSGRAASTRRLAIALGECRLRRSQTLLIQGHSRQADAVARVMDRVSERYLDNHPVGTALWLAHIEAWGWPNVTDTQTLLSLSSALYKSTTQEVRVGALTRTLANAVKCKRWDTAHDALSLLERNDVDVEVCPERLPALLRWKAIYHIETGEHDHADSLLSESVDACAEMGRSGKLDRLLVRFAIAHLYFATGDLLFGADQLSEATDGALECGLVAATITAHRALARYPRPTS